MFRRKCNATLQRSDSQKLDLTVTFITFHFHKDKKIWDSVTSGGNILKCYLISLKVVLLKLIKPTTFIILNQPYFH